MGETFVQSPEMDIERLFRPIVLLPTFNNARNLSEVLACALGQGLPVMVVDDGCTDRSWEILKDFDERVRVVRHQRNLGKAAALRSGFRAAREAGFTHATTLDTDGQLDPRQIPEFSEMARQHPRALVVGCRDETKADYPARSRTGRRVSNFLVRLESGAQVSDSQRGYRVYPLALVEAMKCRAEHFGFETEIITRAAWAGCELRELPVHCTYSPPGGRVSHFRPWLDSMRAVAMHVRLALRALLPWGCQKFESSIQSPQPTRAWWKRMVDWLNPARAWRELRHQRVARTEMAVAVGSGVLIANLPLYPAQTIVALYVARRLHLNPLAVVFGSQLSIVPSNLVLIAAAISLGHFLRHGTWVAISRFSIQQAGLANMMKIWLIDWAIGGLILGIILGAVAFMTTRVVLAWVAQPVSPQD